MNRRNTHVDRYVNAVDEYRQFVGGKDEVSMNLERSEGGMDGESDDDAANE